MELFARMGRLHRLRVLVIAEEVAVLGDLFLLLLAP
jgi:hypothetical protein